MPWGEEDCIMGCARGEMFISLLYGRWVTEGSLLGNVVLTHFSFDMGDH